MAVFHDFKQIIALGLRQRLKGPVVNDQEPGFGQRLEFALIAAIGLGLCEPEPELGEAGVADTVTLLASLMTKCTGKVSLAAGVG